MKKYITLFSIVALFFVGMQSTLAQDANRERPEAIAKQQTYELHKLVDLTGEQQGKVFKVLVEEQTNLSGIEANTKTIAAAQEAKLAVWKKTDASLKGILTQEQYNIYKKSLEKEKK